VGDTVEMNYRHFQYPHKFSTYTSEEHHCALCKQIRLGCYVRPFYGRQQIEFVCEACLMSGKLAEVGSTTNEADVGALHKQLEDMHPDLDAEQIQELVQQRTVEIECKTPHLVTWQHFRWPAHCGDYCCFIKEVGKPDLNKLASDGNGQGFFGEHLHGRDMSITNAPDVWESIRPDSPKDNAVAYSVGVYLFQCLHCHEYVILWDCD
jgi:uncharacterized protein CbrC (UPF0167 family)